MDIQIKRSCYQKNRKDAGKDLEELMIYLMLSNWLIDYCKIW